MTIDEAIAHAREKADKNSGCWKHCTIIKSCETCEQEHEQLAEWLEELKSYRASVFSGDMTQKMLKEAYNKAIDDFAGGLDYLLEKYAIENTLEPNIENVKVSLNYIKKITSRIIEQLKAGEENE